jgi:hypothetical protein
MKKNFYSQKRLPNNLGPKPELRSTVADEQMPRDTAEDGGRKAISEEVRK